MPRVVSKAGHADAGAEEEDPGVGEGVERRDLAHLRDRVGLGRKAEAPRLGEQLLERRRRRVRGGVRRKRGQSEREERREEEPENTGNTGKGHSVLEVRG